MALTHALSTNNYGSAKLIVSTSAANGTHVTLASAMADAVSGDTIFLRDTVTENVTITPGVNISAWSGASLNTPTIIGTLTMTGAGTSTISGIKLQTNGAALLAVTGSAASIVNLNNCYLNCTNATGISFTTSSSSARVNMYYSGADVGTTGINLYSMSSAGILSIGFSGVGNSGASTTAASNSAGLVQISGTGLNIPLSTTSTGAINFYEASYIDVSSQNIAALTANGTGGGSSFASIFSSGTASAISIGTGVSYGVYNGLVASSNTNAITGAGTLVYSGIVFTSSNVINTTTVTRAVLDGGSYKGRNVSTAVPAGMIGEQISSYANSVSLSNGTAANVTSISLTPGLWDVTIVSVGAFTGAATIYQGGISATSATIEGNVGEKYAQNNFVATAPVITFSVPAFRVSLSATTTYYHVAVATFSTGAASGTGTIRATRIA